jgi:hypothetical protein
VIELKDGRFTFLEGESQHKFAFWEGEFGRRAELAMRGAV